MTIKALFVYGSLQPGAENEKYLKHIKGLWKRGYVLGNFVSGGWGSKIGFRAIRLNKKGDPIKGWLLESDEIDKHWKMLDEFEGEEYQRVLTNVHFNDGTQKQAFVYEKAK